MSRLKYILARQNCFFVISGYVCEYTAFWNFSTLKKQPILLKKSLNGDFSAILMCAAVFKNFTVSNRTKYWIRRKKYTNGSFVYLFSTIILILLHFFQFCKVRNDTVITTKFLSDCCIPLKTTSFSGGCAPGNSELTSTFRCLLFPVWDTVNLRRETVEGWWRDVLWFFCFFFEPSRVICEASGWGAESGHLKMKKRGKNWKNVVI